MVPMKSDLYHFEVWLIEGATIIFTQMEAWIWAGWDYLWTLLL